MRMDMMRILLPLWLVLAIGHVHSTTSVLSAQVDVVIFAGQSNMTGAKADITQIAASAVDGQTPYFYDTQGGNINVQRFTSGGALTTLQGVSFQADTGFALDLNRFGPEIGFARKMAELDASFNLAVVKISFGSSFMVDWAKAGGGAFGNAYTDRLITGVNTAMGLFPGDTPVIRGLVWGQGESDAAADPQFHTVFYEDRFGQFLSDFRADIGVPDLPVLAFELNSGLAAPQANVDLFRDEQADYAASDPNAILVSVAGLPLSPSDNRHYESAEMLVLGERAAQAFQSNFATVPEPVHALWIGLGLTLWGVIRKHRKSPAA